MTVPSTTRRAGPYPGNGVATSFPFSFKVYAKADISVVFANSLGVESTLVLDSDYSVTLNADQNANPGGSITYPITGSPMLSSQALAIVGGLDYAQTTALPNGGAYNASIVERALDRITILTQQLRETVNRGVQLAFTTAANVSSRLPAPRGGSVLGWAADGLSLTNFDAAGLGVSVSYAAWQTQTFDGTGAQTAFVLTNDAGVASNCDVVVGGVAQTPGINFSYDSLTKTITFLTGAPPTGTNNVVVRYGQALPQGTIVSANITDSTATGRSVLTAASAAAARTAISAQAALGYTAADDTAVVKLTGAQTIAGVKTFSSQPALPQAPVLVTAQNTNTGTVVDFTGIPSWANRVTVLLDSWSDTGGVNPRVQLGTSTGPETTGYVGTALSIAGGGTAGGPLSAGFEFRNAIGAGASITGSMVLNRVSGNKWVCTGTATDTTVAMTTTGVKTLGAALDRIRITLASGALDAGTATVYYE